MARWQAPRAMQSSRDGIECDGPGRGLRRGTRPDFRDAGPDFLSVIGALSEPEGRFKSRAVYESRSLATPLIAEHRTGAKEIFAATPRMKHEDVL